MLGLPTQNIHDVETDLNKIIELNPEHISVYSLILEEGTLLQQKIEKGELYTPSEVIERKMYWTVKNTLEEAGYKHYEISNFAKSGFESKHNMDCWNQKEYIGFGLAAHSYINNIRYSNTEEFELYCRGRRPTPRACDIRNLISFGRLSERRPENKNNPRNTN